MMQGIAGWQSLTGGPDDPPTKSGISLVDLSGGYVVGDRRPRRAVARAARRGRLRLRHLAARHRAARARLLRHVGGVARVRPAAPPPVGARGDRPVPELPDRGRLDRRRVPEGEVLAAALRARSSGRSSPRSSRPSPTATGGATSSSRSSRRSSARGRARSGSRVLAAAGVPSAPVNDVEAALEEARRRRVRASGSSGRCGRWPRRFGSRTRSRRCGRRPQRGEHTEQVLVELCGYEPERVQRARRRRRLRRERRRHA